MTEEGTRVWQQQANDELSRGLPGTLIFMFCSQLSMSMYALWANS